MVVGTSLITTLESPILMGPLEFPLHRRYQEETIRAEIAEREQVRVQWGSAHYISA